MKYLVLIVAGITAFSIWDEMKPEIDCLYLNDLAACDFAEEQLLQEDRTKPLKPEQDLGLLLPKQPKKERLA